MKLSIITINYNNCEGLRKTIKSVVSQTFRDFEYVIIDGGSTDGSVDVIKEYADRVDYWVSEKDHGIYHAMNKGAFAAHGEYTQFLNSGDYLCDESVLEKVFANQFNEDIVCGNIIADNGGTMRAPEEVTMGYFLKGSLPHPSSFIRKSLFEVHPYDERFEIIGDWEFFVYHLIVGNVTYKKIELFLVVFDTTGVSSTQKKSLKEEELAESIIYGILPERVIKDYDNYSGKYDMYNRLWHTIGSSKLKWRMYTIIVIILKCITFNSGWIKSFPIIRKNKI